MNSKKIIDKLTSASLGILIMLICSKAATAQDKINFLESAFTEVFKTAHQQKKPIMYMFHASWCEHCNKMKKETLTDNDVIAYFNQNYICAWQDMELGQGPMLRKKYNIKSYPAFLFFDTTGVLVSQILGELKPADLIKEAQNAQIKEKQLPFLKKQFEDDISNPTKCLDYIMALRKGRMDFEDVAPKYFKTVEEKNLISEVNWRIFANGIMDIESREFKYVVAHQNEFAEITSKIRVDKKIVYTLNEYLRPAVEIVDTNAYEKRRKSVQKIEHPKVDSILYANDLTMYQKAGMWSKYAQTAPKFIKEFYWNNQSKLREIAQYIVDSNSDKNTLMTAAGWAERALEQRELFDTYLICAKAYQKAGNSTKSKEYAQKAKDLAIKNKTSYQAAEEFLK